MTSKTMQTAIADQRAAFHGVLRRVAAIAALSLASISILARAGAPDFDRDIRPILSDKCFFCHGPDSERREAGLRLDTRGGATESAVVPGDVDSSELVARITSDDESMRMPPVESNLILTEQEKKLLCDWIADGAKYTEHWAFRQLPAEISVPEVKQGDWPQGEIDRFVMARLEAQELSPADRAVPLRLFRRLSLDLRGLTPTVDEVRRFEAEAANDLDAALAAASDRFLASPAFGEHQAIAWLDAARYADSYGYQSDELNTQWPYRDWVVRAFNENLPYDRFLTWQLAGDLLENPSRDQILATAFNRMHRMTSEGGSIAEEWLAENAADRVHTFGSTMLGLTLECARCHDHKYDPILTRDYYSLSAFFNSIDENGMYDHPTKVPSPSLLLPTEEQEQRLVAARQGMEQAEEALAAARESATPRFAEWLQKHSIPTSNALPQSKSPTGVEVIEQSEIPDLVARFTFDGDPVRIANEVASSQLVGNANGLPSVDGYRGKAIRSDGDHPIEFPGLFNIDRWDAFTIDMWVRDTVANEQPSVILQKTYGTDVGYNGYDLTIAGGVLRSRLYRVWPGNALGVRANEPLAPGEWQHVTVTYDGSSRAAGLRIYVNGREASTTIERDKVVKGASFVNDGSGHLVLGERARDRGFKGGEYDDLSIYDRALTPLEVEQLHALQSGDSSVFVAEEADRLFETYLSAYDAPAREAAAALRVARQQFVAAEEGIHEVSVMEELPEPRPTYILPRGAYDAPKTEETRVTRDVFAEMLPPFPADAPRNRLGLARWLTSPDHPLTARVFVNRMWANFFGRGLAATADNFGRQGTAPSHPELLDWLARDFVDHGWDVKRLCRQIVSSATYQQDSRASRELRERDPDNLLLARGPSRRLSAEQIRDLALASSELLSTKQGGPPVYPYQPGQDLWREANSMSPSYTQSTGEGLRRRSLYSVWKRTAPLPNMLVFDATSREVCTISRGRTNTPLQALVLLNDVQFIEAARELASVVAKKHTSANARLTEAFLRLTGRKPDERELTLLMELYQEQLAVFQDDEGQQAAAKLLAIGETQPDESLPTADLAALTVACQAILSLDATIYER